MYLSDVMCESVISTAIAHHKWSVCICVTIGTLGELQYRGGQWLHQPKFQTKPLAEEEPLRACLGEAGRRGSRGCQASPKDTGEAHLLTPPTMGKGMSIGGEGVPIQRGRGTFRGFLRMLRRLGSQGTLSKKIPLTKISQLNYSGPQHLHYRLALGDPGAAPLLSITGTDLEVVGSWSHVFPWPLSP